MHINEEQSFVTFDRLVPADRDFGSAEAIKLSKPAELAVARNAKGVFATRSLQEMYDRAKGVAANLRETLTA